MLSSRTLSLHRGMTPRHTIREDPPSCPAQLQRGVEKPAACLLCPAEPCMHFHPFLYPPSWRASSLFLDPVPRSMLASFQDLLVILYSPSSRLGNVCMNTLRLLSLKMAAAIPGSNPSFSVNRVYMHLSHRTNLCRRGLSNRVSLSPIKRSAAPAGPHRSVMPTLAPAGSVSLYRGQCHPI